MVDVFTAAKRSEIMSKIGGKDTVPELRVRRLLHALGYRFRLHRSDLPGKPDIVLPRHRKITFVHGCFWHGHRGCPRAKLPSTNTAFWRSKIGGNVYRDQRTRRKLAALGWEVLIVWQCELANLHALTDRLFRFLQATRPRRASNRSRSRKGRQGPNKT